MKEAKALLDELPSYPIECPCDFRCWHIADLAQHPYNVRYAEQGGTPDLARETRHFAF